MPQSIVDFIHNFKSDFSKPSRFEVTIPKIPGGLNSTKTNLMYRCESAELPSITYATLEQKFGSNPIEKYPYQVQFNDLSLTFIVGSDMDEKKFFDSWMELIVPSSTYNMNYKEKYVTDVRITQFDSTDIPTYAVDLMDAYPITVNQLDLDWSSTESYHKLTVVFAYTYWMPITNPKAETVRTAVAQPSRGPNKNNINPELNKTPTGVISKNPAEQILNKTPGAFVSKIPAEQDLNKTPNRVGPRFTPIIR
jgi:hypothetical protein